MSDDIVRIELGSSLLDAELAVQVAQNQGLNVQLLRNYHPEIGSFHALGSCVLLVAASQEAALRQVLTDHGIVL